MVVFSLWIDRGIVWRVIVFILALGATAAGFTVAIIYTYSGNVNVPAELKDVCGYYKQYFSDYKCNCMRQ